MQPFNNVPNQVTQIVNDLNRTVINNNIKESSTEVSTGEVIALISTTIITMMAVIIVVTLVLLSVL